MDNQNALVNIIEYIALIVLGVIFVVIFLHLLNGTLGEWINAKFHAFDTTKE